MKINPVLEEMLAHAELQGTSCNSMFDLNGQKINIPRLKLSDLDWEMLESFISHSNASINLIFVIMLFHFQEKFDYQNLMNFINFGNKKVSELATEMLANLNACSGEGERTLFVKDLILKLDT